MDFLLSKGVRKIPKIPDKSKCNFILNLTFRKPVHWEITKNTIKKIN